MATADAADATLTGRRLGPWVLYRRIGRGGLGEVWHGQRDDGLFDGHVAIKLLHGDGASPAVARRFLRERTALGRLTHSRIAALLDAGVQGLHAYLVLELVDGQPLSAYVRERRLDVGARVALLLDVAEAVAYAHGRLVVHRDLKPANVMVTPAGVPKLLDFGLAASPGEDLCDTRAGLTPGYAAPELIEDDDTGVAVDVYALGALLFELLTGHLPFGQRIDSAAAMTHAVLHTPPHRVADLLKRADDPTGPGRPPDARRALGDLEAIARQALARQREDRYVSVHAFTEDLRRWQQQRPVAGRGATGWRRWRHDAALLLRRHALGLGTGAVVLACLTGGIAATATQWQTADAARQRSDTVSGFLTELLAEGSVPRDGRPPTVLELLDDSRDRLATFSDDPATRARLLQVLSRTYMALNRFDDALPLGEQWLALARQQHGEDEAPVLLARLSLGQIHQIIGNDREAIALLEPIGEALARRFGPDSEPVRLQLFSLAADYMHSRRLAEADRALERVRVLTELLHPGDEYELADYLQNLSVLRQRQGRLAEALTVLRQTRPMWSSTNPKLGLQLLVLRQSEISLMGENAQFEGVDERAEPLLADIQRALGPGNDLSLQVYSAYATVLRLQGRHAEALRTTERLLAQARADGRPPAALLFHRGEWLLAQATRGRLDHAQARAVLTEAAALPGDNRRGRSLLLVAEAAIADGDTALAVQALRRVRELPLPASLTSGGNRLARAEGRLARAQGDLARSAELLTQRLAQVRATPDTGFVQVWSAHLDIAITAVLQGAAGAAQRLAEARAARPGGLAPGHPLDTVSRWVEARHEAGRDDAPAVREAWAALAALRGGPVTVGSLGGLLP